MSIEKENDLNNLQHLKQVSRIKHTVLEKYLPPWATILGLRNQRLCYFDCYAGPGVYEFEGKRKEGSPIIAVKTAKNYLSRHNGREMTIVLVEKNDEIRASLERELEKLKPYEKGLRVQVYGEDTKTFIPRVLEGVPKLAPSFFMVDPYGHPLTIPILNDILKRSKTETLINFMYYRINMDAGNDLVKHHVDEMFGNKEWRNQPFLKETGFKRENGFLEYFKNQINARYKLHFKIRYDPEDRISISGAKYYLTHVSNNVKAVLLMKDVMWPLGDDEGMFDYSGERGGFLFSLSPTEKELEEYLIKNYSRKEVEFDHLREETWELPFIEKHYRNVIKRLEKDGQVAVKRVDSKKTGLRKRDRVLFYPPK